MWCVKEFNLIVQELKDWDPEFNRNPMKKIPKKGGKTVAKNLSGGCSLFLKFFTELKCIDV